MGGSRYYNKKRLVMLFGFVFTLSLVIGSGYAVTLGPVKTLTGVGSANVEILPVNGDGSDYVYVPQSLCNKNALVPIMAIYGELNTPPPYYTKTRWGYSIGLGGDAYLIGELTLSPGIYLPKNVEDKVANGAHLFLTMLENLPVPIKGNTVAKSLFFIFAPAKDGATYTVKYTVAVSPTISGYVPESWDDVTSYPGDKVYEDTISYIQQHGGKTIERTVTIKCVPDDSTKIKSKIFEGVSVNPVLSTKPTYIPNPQGTLSTTVNKIEGEEARTTSEITATYPDATPVPEETIITDGTIQGSDLFKMTGIHICKYTREINPNIPHISGGGTYVRGTPESYGTVKLNLCVSQGAITIHNGHTGVGGNPWHFIIIDPNKTYKTYPPPLGKAVYDNAEKNALINMFLINVRPRTTYAVHMKPAYSWPAIPKNMPSFEPLRWNIYKGNFVDPTYGLFLFAPGTYRYRVTFDIDGNAPAWIQEILKEWGNGVVPARNNGALPVSAIREAVEAFKSVERRNPNVPYVCRQVEMRNKEGKIIFEERICVVRGDLTTDQLARLNPDVWSGYAVVFYYDGKDIKVPQNPEEIAKALDYYADYANNPLHGGIEMHVVQAYADETVPTDSVIRLMRAVSIAKDTPYVGGVVGRLVVRVNPNTEAGLEKLMRIVSPIPYHLFEPLLAQGNGIKVTITGEIPENINTKTIYITNLYYDIQKWPLTTKYLYISTPEFKHLAPYLPYTVRKNSQYIGFAGKRLTIALKNLQGFAVIETCNQLQDNGDYFSASDSTTAIAIIPPDEKRYPQYISDLLKSGWDAKCKQHKILLLFGTGVVYTELPWVKPREFPIIMAENIDSIALQRLNDYIKPAQPKSTNTNAKSNTTSKSEQKKNTKQQPTENTSSCISKAEQAACKEVPTGPIDLEKMKMEPKYLQLVAESKNYAIQNWTKLSNGCTDIQCLQNRIAQDCTLLELLAKMAAAKHYAGDRGLISTMVDDKRAKCVVGLGLEMILNHGNSCVSPTRDVIKDAQNMAEACKDLIKTAKTVGTSENTGKNSKGAAQESAETATKTTGNEKKAPQPAPAASSAILKQIMALIQQIFALLQKLKLM